MRPSKSGSSQVEKPLRDAGIRLRNAMLASIKVFMSTKRRPLIAPAILPSLFSVLLLVTSAVARAQTIASVNYEGENVMAIDLASRPEADVEYLRALIVQKTGEPYSNDKI